MKELKKNNDIVNKQKVMLDEIHSIKTFFEKDYTKVYVLFEKVRNLENYVNEVDHLDDEGNISYKEYIYDLKPYSQIQEINSHINYKISNKEFDSELNSLKEDLKLLEGMNIWKDFHDIYIYIKSNIDLIEVIPCEYEFLEKQLKRLNLNKSMDINYFCSYLFEQMNSMKLYKDYIKLVMHNSKFNINVAQSIIKLDFIEWENEYINLIAIDDIKLFFKLENLYRYKVMRLNSSEIESYTRLTDHLNLLIESIEERVNVTTTKIKKTDKYFSDI